MLAAALRYAQVDGLSCPCTACVTVAAPAVTETAQILPNIPAPHMVTSTQQPITKGFVLGGVNGQTRTLVPPQR